jgi:hypothetical protein
VQEGRCKSSCTYSYNYSTLALTISQVHCYGRYHTPGTTKYKVTSNHVAPHWLSGRRYRPCRLPLHGNDTIRKTAHSSSTCCKLDAALVISSRTAYYYYFSCSHISLKRAQIESCGNDRAYSNHTRSCKRSASTNWHRFRSRRIRVGNTRPRHISGQPGPGKRSFRNLVPGSSSPDATPRTTHAARGCGVHIYWSLEPRTGTLHTRQVNIRTSM